MLHPPFAPQRKRCIRERFQGISAILSFANPRGGPGPPPPRPPSRSPPPPRPPSRSAHDRLSVFNLLMMSENSRGFWGILRLFIDLSFSLSRLSDDICLRDIVKCQNSIKKTLTVIFRSSHSIQIYHLKILSRHNSIVV